MCQHFNNSDINVIQLCYSFVAIVEFVRAAKRILLNKVYLYCRVFNPVPGGFLSCIFKMLPAPTHLVQMNGSLSSLSRL